MGMPAFNQGYRWCLIRQSFPGRDGFGRRLHRFSWHRGDTRIWVGGWLLSYYSDWDMYPPEDGTHTEYTPLRDLFRKDGWLHGEFMRPWRPPDKRTTRAKPTPRGIWVVWKLLRRIAFDAKRSPR